MTVVWSATPYPILPDRVQKCPVSVTEVLPISRLLLVKQYMIEFVQNVPTKQHPANTIPLFLTDAYAVASAAGRSRSELGGATCKHAGMRPVVNLNLPWYSTIAYGSLFPSVSTFGTFVALSINTCRDISKPGETRLAPSTCYEARTNVVCSA